MTRQAISIALALATLGTVLSLAATAKAVPPPPAIVTGLDAGWPDVRGWGRNGARARQWASWGEWPIAFSPYPTYQEGVRVEPVGRGLESGPATAISV